ncbi:MAG: IclR family transcriptional regulator [Desulfocapsaceae bacterium]
MQRSRKRQQTHSSLEKGLHLLSVFIPDNREMGTVEISKSFSMNRSTVSRMLNVLRKQGFVRHNPESKKYSLGPQIYSLAVAYSRSFESVLTQIAKPHLDQLRLDLHQTVVLEIPLGDRVMVIYVTEGLGPIKISARVGDRHCYHTSAGGKCILAFSSKEFIEDILSSELQSFTPKTITDPAQLGKELDTVRRTAFAFDNEGNNPGISAFAVPVLDQDGTPVAAIVTAGPSNQMVWNQRKIYLKGLQDAAGKVRQQLLGDSMNR